MTFEFISYQEAEGVATITLNRPDVLNSFHRAMALELQSALDQVRDKDEIRALLLTGAGRGFCAGQDLSEVLPKEGEPEPVLGDTVHHSYNPIIMKLRALPKPVICAVNGVAAGAGANIAFACDLVFASEKANFVQSFCKLGLVPDSGGTYFLPRLVGLPRATAMAMLGDKVSAADALAMGMIYRVTAPDQLMEEAARLARHLATQPTKGLGLIKAALNASLNNDLETQLALEREYQTRAGRTQDYKEGVAAFLAKRPPVYKGN